MKFKKRKRKKKGHLIDHETKKKKLTNRVERPAKSFRG